MKISLIGLGEISSFQIEALNKVEDIIICDACDIDSNVASKLPKNVIFYSDLNNLIKYSKADIFLISTPTKTHFEIIKKLINHNKKILVEKPMCYNMEELSILRELYKNNNSFLSTAFHASFGQEIIWWKKYFLENKKTIGNVKNVFSDFYDPYINGNNLKTNTTSLVGSWIDSGINALGVLDELFTPSEMYVTNSKMTKITHFHCEQVQGSSLIEFKTGIENQKFYSYIDTNWCLNLNQKRTRIIYDNLEVILNHSLESIYIVVDQKEELLVDLRNNNHRLVNQYIQLFKNLLKKPNTIQSNFNNSYKLHKVLFESSSF